jgi:hypothetical protein
LVANAKLQHLIENLKYTAQPPGASVATIRSNLGIRYIFGVSNLGIRYIFGVSNLGIIAVLGKINLGIIAILGVSNLGIIAILAQINLGIRYIFISFAPENIQITHDIQEKTIQRNAGVENQLQGQVCVAD